jgi:SAM-dependent methyltransferase
MKKGFKQRYVDPWKDYMQRYQTLYWAPGKPTDKEREIFYKFVKSCMKKGKNKGLVLGATPAMRDILAKLNIEITLLDASKGIIDSMGRLIKHNKKENKVVGDWLNMPFNDNSFDFVLGDLVLENVDGKNKEIFFKEIKRVLKPKGYWIHRIFFVPKEWIVEPVEEVLKMFSKLKHPYDRNTELFCYLMYNTYNPKTHEVYLSGMKKMLTKYWKNNKYVYPNDRVVEGLLNRAYDMWKPMTKVWHTGRKEEVYSWISKYFDIIKENNDKGHMFGRWFPIVVCRAK